MSIKPGTPEAFQLMMEGSAALTDVEQNGMRIDVNYLDRMLYETQVKIDRMKQGLKQDALWKMWYRRFGYNADLNKRTQLADILYNVLGHEVKHTTAKGGKPKTDMEALEEIDLPFVKRWVDIQKLQKCRSTYLMGIRREVVDGFLRPFFNLHTTITYRSSSSEPNFQNQPIRDPRQAKLIRRAFIPRSKDHVLLEVDYGALEFRGAAIFWQDPAMVEYASDPNLDIHRDLAAECYLLPTDRVSKTARSRAKNSFTFPELYGSYYRKIAEHMWTLTSRENIRTADDVDIFEHLRGEGICTAQDFEEHIKKVEQRFGERFSHWSEQRDVWWKQYLGRGWFPLLTGFVCSGIYKRNDLMNYPIQGPSFHMLLWSLIRLNEWMKSNRMLSKIIGQIHDSIFMDVHKKELDDVLVKTNQVMTRDVRKHWEWIIVPLEIEAELSETTWFDKREIAIPSVD